MISYRIAKGSILIIEEGTTSSPNGSGLTFEVSGLQYPTLGDAVNASSVPVKNLWSGTAFLDNRAQTFYGQNTFTQPLVAQQAVLPTQLATIGQVASYNNLSGTGGGSGPNNSSQISGVQNLAINNQSRITILTSNESGINSTLGVVQLKTTVLESNFSGLPTINPALTTNLSGINNLAVNNQARITSIEPKVITLQNNQSGIQSVINSLQLSQGVVTGIVASGIINTTIGAASEFSFVITGATGANSNTIWSAPNINGTYDWICFQNILPGDEQVTVLFWNPDPNNGHSINAIVRLFGINP